MNFWPSTCQQYLVPLKYTCRMNPEVLAESTDPDFEMEYIDIGNVSLEHGIGQLQAFRFYGAPSRARKIVRKGDTLISTVRTYLKAIAYIEEDHTNWIASTGFAILRPDVGIDPRFLYRVAQASPFVEAVVASSTGVSYPAINPSTLGSIEIPLPDLVTQKAIADFLDRETARIDQLIEKKERQVSLLKEKETALVTAAVTKGLNRKAGMTETNVGWLGSVPSHWTVCTLGLRYSIKLGKMLDQARQTGQHLRPYLRVYDVQWGTINVNDLPQMDFTPGDRARFRLLPGDLLVNEGGSYVGRSAIWEGQIEECYYQKALHRLRPHDATRDSSRFFIHVMSAATRLGVFIAGGNQTTIDHLTAEAFGKYLFAFPPIDEQLAITAHLDDRQNEIRKATLSIEQSISHLREFRSALITSAVTGQIDVASWSKRGETDRSLDALQESYA